jgi:lysophospholipase L1-like esterase
MRSFADKRQNEGATIRRLWFAILPLLHFVAADKIAVQPIGDSITFGCGAQCEHNCMDAPDTQMGPCSQCAGGYRQHLWRSLNAAYPGEYVFVGTQLNGPAEIDRHHEGHPGLSLTGAVGLWRGAKPSVVLLHLGTNDLAGGSADRAAAQMDKLLHALFADLPRTHVLVASIIGTKAAWGGAKHAAFNALLPSLARTYAAKGFLISFVDMARESGIAPMCDDAVNCCPFAVHPNDEGYRKMAAVWFNATVRHRHASGRSVADTNDDIGAGTTPEDEALLSQVSDEGSLKILHIKKTVGEKSLGVIEGKWEGREV